MQLCQNAGLAIHGERMSADAYLATSGDTQRRVLRRLSGYHEQPCTFGFLIKEVPTAKAESRYGGSY